MFIVLGGMTPMSQMTGITVSSTSMSGTRIMVFWHRGQLS